MPIPYPGSTPNFEGLLAIAAAAHAAAEGFHMSIKTMIIDEEQSTVALLLNVTGKHVGYGSPLWCHLAPFCLHFGTDSDGSEWLGIPATGKEFSTFDFVMIKVRSLCMVRGVDGRLIRLRG